MSGDDHADYLALVKRFEQRLMDQVQKDMVVYSEHPEEVKKRYTE